MHNKLTMTIAAGNTVSSEITLSGALPVGLYIDPLMTSTSITFEVSPLSGGTYSLVSDGLGGSYTRNFRAGDFLPLDPATFAGVSFFKIIAGSTETAARNLILVSSQG